MAIGSPAGARPAIQRVRLPPCLPIFDRLPSLAEVTSRQQRETVKARLPGCGVRDPGIGRNVLEDCVSGLNNRLGKAAQFLKMGLPQVRILDLPPSYAKWT